MASYRKPASDTNRLANLRTAYETGNSATNGNQFLSQATLTAVHELAANFEAVLQAVAQLTGQRATATATADARARELAFLVQDARRTLRANVRLGKLPAAALRHYGLSNEGRVAQPNTRSGWLQLAEKLLNGEASAQEDGVAALPNQAALAAGYDAGKNAEENVVQITGALVAARTHLQTQRALVVNQIRALVCELRYNLAEQPLPRQREIMRTYGVRFQAEDGEAAEIPVPDSGQEAELALA